MKIKHTTFIKNILLPCIAFSTATGLFTGALIYLFKLAFTAVIGLSDGIYAFVREEPIYLPLLLLGAAAVGLVSALILRAEPSCRGGGIPSAIAILRGLVTFQWLRSLITVFLSSLLTYLGGVPLGTEGPSVQMGTSIGRGTVRLFAKNNLAWDRYVMTGGACAGFACATGAPLSGIFFAFEDAHRRFSPMIFMTAAWTVFIGSATTETLCSLTDTESRLFSLHINEILPMRYLWVVILLGLITGFLAIAFSKLYRTLVAWKKRYKRKLPLLWRVPLIFVATAAIGFASSHLIGTGHGLIEHLLEGDGVWYLLILYLAVRVILLLFATTNGVTGGLFIPSLAFGALIGAIVAKALIGLEILPKEHYVLIVCVSMAAFLSSSSRIPITAIAFAIEALGCIYNLIPVIACVTVSYLVIEVSRTPAFIESVVDGKEEAENEGKIATVIDERVTVAHGAFAVEKEIRDILWPPTCTVLSVVKAENAVGTAIAPGDVLHIHYRTYCPDETRLLLNAIVGEQSGDVDPNARIYTADTAHQTPQL